ncbi:MAG: ZIP family metal transporter [Gammaproteobacteria bacterium]|nr:ZIP family metal transporter [Gammaproteobacteria bacterium]
MNVLSYILLFTLLGGALSALAASLFLLVPERGREVLLPHLISFATGALLGAALLALLPHAVGEIGVDQVHKIGLAVLAGILVFFLLEKMVLWRHCHADDCVTHGPEQHHRDKSAASMILVGDGIHNLLDGILIAGAFLTDIHLGVVTAVAVIAHEIPQEVGDLAVLLKSGMSRARALWLNLLASITSVAGGVLAYFWLVASEDLLPYVLAVAASSFLYVAVADLIPGLHRRVDARTSVQQVLLIIAGVLVIYYSHATLH